MCLSCLPRVREMKMTAGNFIHISPFTMKSVHLRKPIRHPSPNEIALLVLKTPPLILDFTHLPFSLYSPLYTPRGVPVPGVVLPYSLQNLLEMYSDIIPDDWSPVLPRWLTVCQ